MQNMAPFSDIIGDFVQKVAPSNDIFGDFANDTAGSTSSILGDLGPEQIDEGVDNVLQDNEVSGELADDPAQLPMEINAISEALLILSDSNNEQQQQQQQQQQLHSESQHQEGRHLVPRKKAAPRKGAGGLRPDKVFSVEDGDM